jgi:hypothetical protein
MLTILSVFFSETRKKLNTTASMGGKRASHEDR